MELPHDREYLEHPLRGFRGLPPIPSIVGELGNPLSRAETIINRATSKPPLPEAVVNAATEVRSQVMAGFPGFFIDCEVYRGREGQGDAAQAEAIVAVGLQA